MGDLYKKILIRYYYLDKLLEECYVNVVPSRGDMVRFKEDIFYTVDNIIWCMNEKECPYDRCNINLI